MMLINRHYISYSLSNDEDDDDDVEKYCSLWNGSIQVAWTS
jgi:hypothetical protein